MWTLCLCVQTADSVYSMVNEPVTIPTMHHKDGSAVLHQQQQRPLQVGSTNNTLLSQKWRCLRLHLREPSVEAFRRTSARW